MEKALLTVAEVSARLGLSRSLVYRYIMSGQILSIKCGRARRVPVAAVDEFVRRLQEEQAEMDGER